MNNGRYQTLSIPDLRLGHYPKSLKQLVSLAIERLVVQTNAVTSTVKL